MAAHQAPEFDIEHLLIVDDPFVVAVATEGVTAMTLAGFGALER